MMTPTNIIKNEVEIDSPKKINDVAKTAPRDNNRSRNNINNPGIRRRPTEFIQF